MLHYGTKVQVINPYYNGLTGVVKTFLWNTQDYIICTPSGKCLPFKRKELEVV